MKNILKQTKQKMVIEMIFKSAMSALLISLPITFLFSFLISLYFLPIPFVISLAVSFTIFYFNTYYDWLFV